MVTALNDWCEENYVWTPYIAEFWNTLSNVIYLLVGAWTIKEFSPNVRSGGEIYQRLQICVLALCCIGVGSMAYHGAVTRWGQAMDELAILYWEVTLLTVVFERSEVHYPMLRFAYAPFA